MSSSSDQGHDHDDEAFLAATSAEELVGALAKNQTDGSSRKSFEDVEQIRVAFESVMGELTGESGADMLRPDFPGYLVTEKLGQGAFGAVYRARDEKLGREVALKVLVPRFSGSGTDGPEAKARFLKEARALARVRHQNVLTIHAVLEDPGQTAVQIALVTEFIDGQPLNDILESKGPLSATEAAQAGAEICHALAAVHAAGVIHRDVKTANILRERGGRMILADFGLGVFLAEGGPPEREGFVAGSPLFMSPEQIRGADVDGRTDLYALGIVLYNLSTGKFPVTAKSVTELFAKIKGGELTPLRDARPDLPEGFTQVVTKALSTEPGDRYQSAGEMEQALLSSLGTAPRGSTAPPESTAGAGRPVEAAPRSRRLGPLTLAFAAVVLVLTAALLFIFQDDDSFLVNTKLWFHSPDVAPRPLADGDRIGVGDALSLAFGADRTLYVYVLNQDQRGAVNLLFPQPGGWLGNPLPGGVRHELPGIVDGRRQNWEVSSKGGEEYIFIVGSTEPVSEIESALWREGALTGGDLVTLKRGFRRRGIGRLTPQLSPGIADNYRLAEVVAELNRKADNSVNGKGFWVGKITLKNP